MIVFRGKKVVGENLSQAQPGDIVVIGVGVYEVRHNYGDRPQPYSLHYVKSLKVAKGA